MKFLSNQKLPICEKIRQGGLRQHQKYCCCCLSGSGQIWKLLADERLWLCLWLSFGWARVDRSMFDRQIDLIMNLHHCTSSSSTLLASKMTFADWRLDLDSALQSWCHYWGRLWLSDEIRCSTRSIHMKFANYQKSAGWICSECWQDSFLFDPYRVHPMFLWAGQAVWVMCILLIHEIGHSGQFIFSDNSQSYFNTHMSTYYVKLLLPSTNSCQRLFGTSIWQSRQKRFALAAVNGH